MTNRSFHRTHALLLALAVIAALVVPFAGVAVANHPGSTCLDVEPEDEANPVGSLHTLTATLRVIESTTVTCEADATQGGPGGPRTVPTNQSGVNIDFEIDGTNDPDDSNSPGTPDLSCTILPGASSCTVQYQGTVTGDDVIRGWIDHDGTDASQGGNTEADTAEGPNSTTHPGTGCTSSGGATGATPPEPDCTDVVTKEWTAGPPAALDCDDQNGPDTERETNPSQAGGNSNETYTCTVTDEDGNPTDNRDVTVFGEVENTVNDPEPEGSEGATYENPDYRCSTEDTNNDGDEDGTCTITVGQVDGEVGTAEICFWIEEQGAGSDDFSFTSEENPDEGGDANHCGGESTAEAQAADGSDVGNDEADQVEKTWEARRASAVDAEPESDTNEPGQDHTVTAFVYDQFGGTFTGSTTVRFEFFEGSPSDTDGNTPATPDRSCTTQNSNSCSITYTSQEQGLDRICVYVGNAPSMSGNNTNGTCDGETLVDEDDEAGSADAPEGNDDQDVVQKRWGAAGTATRLDCNPETATNPTGTSHTVTCTATDSQNQPVEGANVDAEATGANDPDNANSPDSPDFTCTTNAQGQCSFTHGSGGQGSSTQTGTTTYRAWIDSGNNAAVEADPSEGPNESNSPGNEGEPDNTDVVTKTWTGDTRRIDCEPETDSNPTGTTHTVTCTLTDNQGQPVSGEQVTFTEEGAGEIQGSSSDTSDQNGQVTVTTTSAEAGDQTITGTVNDDLQGTEPNEVDECDRAANDPQGAPAGECSDSVTKTWVEDQAPECSDGLDNDGDGEVDYPNDPGCDSATDNDETDTFPNQEFGGEQGQPVTDGACAGFTTGSVQQDPNGTGLIIVGTNGNDALQGSEDADLICALDGDDTVQGHGGNDTIHGGGGKDAIEAGLGDDSVFGDDDKDVILGDEGNDQLFGGQGNDNMSGGGGLDELRGQGGWDTLKGNAADDLLVGARGNDILQGGGGNDVARAGAGDDVLKGYVGNDELRGGGGDDLIKGSAGRDRLFGNAGNDVLNGGANKDRCRGGRGRDILRNCP